MSRIYQPLSDAHKEKISQSMQAYHNRKSTSDAMRTRKKQSDAMSEYWSMKRYLRG